MDENVYKAPTSDIDIKQPVKGSTLKGIGYAALIDILGSITFGMLFSIGYIAFLISQGASEEQAASSLLNIEFLSLINLFATAVGAGISCFAGYICAKKSVVHIYRNATILSFISTAFGLSIGYEVYSIIENIFMVVLTVSVIFLGTYLWSRLNRSLDQTSSVISSRGQEPL